MEIRDFISDNGLRVVLIKTNKFKTIELNLFLSDRLDYKSVTTLNLLAILMKSASKNHPSVKEFSTFLKENYRIMVGASLTNLGETNTVNFKVRGLNAKFLENENINEKLFYILDEMVNNPLIEDGKFKDSYYDEQLRIYKETLEASRDYKEKVTIQKVNDIMGKDTPYGVFKDGDLRDLENLKNEDVVNEYQKLINRDACLYVIGDIEENEIQEYLSKYLKMSSKRSELSLLYKAEMEDKGAHQEQASFTQSSICLVYNFPIYKGDELSNAAKIYASMFNHYLFKIVREKHNFCYSIFARYDAYLGVINVYSNIESKNYDKTLELIDEIIEDLKNTEAHDVVEMTKGKIVNSYHKISDLYSSYVELHYYERLLGNEFDIDNITKEINEVTIEQVREVATKISRKLSFILKEKS